MTKCMPSSPMSCCSTASLARLTRSTPRRWRRSACRTPMDSCRLPAGGNARMSSPPSQLFRRERQVGVLGLAGRVGQHAMDLAAWVGLMVEHMRDDEPAGSCEIFLGRAGIISLIGGEPRLIDAVGPADDRLIEIRPLDLQ